METHPLPLNFNWIFIDVPTFPWLFRTPFPWLHPAPRSAPLRLPQGRRGNGLGGDLPKQGRSVAVEALRAQPRRQRSRVVQILQDDPMPRIDEDIPQENHRKPICFRSYLMIYDDIPC